eukprot:TRINITY_DN4697_c0_g2_i6.p1 TRINITY_DN4697_c0_g2~~TRINITY_DN4697_c0_g2_i6.p1  ORF type:complete len:158 (+),score=54.91 TRINITY_DN4697_c0_g2_i6:194-667(+)
MNSPEMEQLRYYRNDSAKHIWTATEVQKFGEALAIYGYGPTANRKIAEYIGNGIHPNHVAHYKLQCRRQKRIAEKEKSAKTASGKAGLSAGKDSGKRLAANKSLGAAKALAAAEQAAAEHAAAAAAAINHSSSATHNSSSSSSSSTATSPQQQQQGA